MTPQEAREAATAFIRSVDPDALRLWEMDGPPNTAIRSLECWAMRTAEGGRGRVVVVQIFGDRNGRTGGGWQVLAEVGTLEIKNTRECLGALDAVEADPTALTDA